MSGTCFAIAAAVAIDDLELETHPATVRIHQAANLATRRKGSQGALW